MSEMSDMDLVRQYARCHSESAFAELVCRHINLVYSVALRYVGNVQDAEDVTQAVFMIFARKTAALSTRTALTGWLYETTRFAAARFLRTRARRHAREQEGCVQSGLNDADNDSVWEQLTPLLDEAMGGLTEKERALLALRYFENRSGAETAALLGIEEWAAHKRTERAVEKLRAFFARRGIAVSAGSLIGAVSANSVQAAPAALAQTATAFALANGTAAGSSTLALVKGALKLMAWTKAKTAMVASAALLLAAGTTTVLVKKHIEAVQYGVTSEPWSDVGATTPKAALQSLAWALTHNRMARAEELMQWDEQGVQYGMPTVHALQRQLALQSDLAPAVRDLESFRILSIKRTKQTNEVAVTVEKTFKNRSIAPFSVTAKLRRFGSQWRVVGRIEYSEHGVSTWLPFMASF